MCIVHFRYPPGYAVWFVHLCRSSNHTYLGINPATFSKQSIYHLLVRRRQLVQFLLLILGQLAVPVLEVRNILPGGSHEKLG